MRFLFSRGLLSVALACTLVACDSNDSEESALSGVVLSPSNLPVAGATVTASSSSAASAGTAALRLNDEAVTDQNGEYVLELEPGTYTVTVSRPGYNDQTFSATVGDGEDEAPDVQLLGGATLSGIVNSSQGGRLDSATVTFSFSAPGMDPLNSEPELSFTTDSTGVFDIPNAPTGTLDCVIYADGFEPSVIPGIDVEEGENDLGESAVVQTPPSGAVRVTLTWGAQPRDLDSHLTGPDGSDGRYHVYFSDRVVGNSTLDTDDRDGFGPETITFFPREADGMYRYSVHNWSDQDSGEMGARGIAGLDAAGSPLADGRAARIELIVTDENGAVTDSRVYTAPTAGSSADANTWRVFEITNTAGALSIDDGGSSAGLSYEFASGSGDIDVFRSADAWYLQKK